MILIVILIYSYLYFFQGMFVVLAIGNAFSILTLSLEILSARILRRKTMTLSKQDIPN